MTNTFNTIGKITREASSTINTTRFPCDFVSIKFERNVYVSQEQKTIVHRYKSLGGTGPWESYNTYEPINKWGVYVEGSTEPVCLCNSEERANKKAQILVNENWQMFISVLPASKKDIAYLNSIL